MAKEVSKIFEAESTEIKENTEIRNFEFEDKRRFEEIDTHIRQLHSELRRVCKTDTEGPVFVETKVCSSFDAVKGENVPFKVACGGKVPPLKIKFLANSTDCMVYISQNNPLPTAEK